MNGVIRGQGGIVGGQGWTGVRKVNANSKGSQTGKVFQRSRLSSGGYGCYDL